MTTRRSPPGRLPQRRACGSSWRSTRSRAGGRCTGRSPSCASAPSAWTSPAPRSSGPAPPGSSPRCPGCATPGGPPASSARPAGCRSWTGSATCSTRAAGPTRGASTAASSRSPGSTPRSSARRSARPGPRWVAGSTASTRGRTSRSTTASRTSAAIARRGADNAAINGGPGDSSAASHHFTIRLDDDLLSTPYVDFRANPDGIDGTTGVQIAGGFTVASARDLVVMLALPPLPMRVHVVSSSVVP